MNRGVIDKFFRCVKTLQEMLHDRGYELNNEEFDYQLVNDHLKSIDLADPIRSQKLLNDDSFTIEGTHKISGDHVKVYWLCGKIGVNSPTLEKVRETFSNMEDAIDVVSTVIFVSFEGASVSAPAKKDMMSIPAVIEYFDSSEIQRNITQHELQPKFKLLSDHEATDIKNKYGATNEQLPKISMDDPIRRYFGAKKGQIFQCKRLSENGVDPMYRIVE